MVIDPNNHNQKLSHHNYQQSVTKPNHYKSELFIIVLILTILITNPKFIVIDGNYQNQQPN